MGKFFLPLVFVALFSASCSPVLSPFTESLYRQNRWTESELKQIQFYVSDNIVLRRVLSGSASEIVSGEIKMIDGKQVEEVVIRSGTPGVLLFMPKSDRFAIGFESDTDDRFLMFGPNPKMKGRFALLASEWEDRSGIVTYGDKKYRVASTGAFSSLMVNLRNISKTSVSSRTAGGRKVN